MIDSPPTQEELISFIAVPFFQVLLLIIAPTTADNVLVSNGTMNPPL